MINKPSPAKNIISVIVKTKTMKSDFEILKTRINVVMILYNQSVQCESSQSLKNPGFLGSSVFRDQQPRDPFVLCFSLGLWFGVLVEFVSRALTDESFMAYFFFDLGL
jgi:hypothetical protein